MKWLRKLAERYLDKYEEGPEPPDRIAFMVDEFMSLNPDATKYDWAKFAAVHAAQSYREGYVRGVEYVERDPDQWWPDPAPDVVADSLTPSWRDSEPFNMNHIPKDPVPKTSYESEEQALKRQLEILKGNGDGLAKVGGN